MKDQIESVGSTESFSVNVFSDEVMKQRLDPDVYKKLKDIINRGTELDRSVADAVAEPMRRWAAERGAIYYTHWFQPMTGYTAEKHDAFISPGLDGIPLVDFTGRDLIRGESDASSFPTGGLRATFEARGYTAWDCTSPAFVKNNTLYIPTVFCSFTGETLDKKTPLLRSVEAISREAIRILRVFGNTSVEKVIPQVGPEQEYFLVERELFMRRKDLMFCGRTLFGSRPLKGQELEDHYYGSISERVKKYMLEVDRELWSLGIAAKTEHNEVAPNQHELAVVYRDANIACDHNQIVMEAIKKVALRHGLVCLLHEKPFAGVNGSGKHNNWSLSTEDGHNLLKPGKTPGENAQFLIFLCAVIRAVDENAELLAASVASAGNDCRLGGNEAPPAIVSIFLGSFLTEILTEIETGMPAKLRERESVKIGVTSLPTLPKDTTDRNRTSPLAFTGNKFEFRMPGSSCSVTDCNMVINSTVADTLSVFADRLEKAADINAEVRDIVRETMRENKRVIYNGNNYSDEWMEIAKGRGLPIIRSCVDAASALISDKTVDLLGRHKILNKVELAARYEVALENYVKTVRIEANTMLEMAKRQILPASIRYGKELSDALNSMKATGLAVDVSTQASLLKELSAATALLRGNIAALDRLLDKSIGINDANELARYHLDSVIPAMNAIRLESDKLEMIIAVDSWPLPTYSDLLFAT